MKKQNESGEWVRHFLARISNGKILRSQIVTSSWGGRNTLTEIYLCVSNKSFQKIKNLFDDL